MSMFTHQTLMAVQPDPRFTAGGGAVAVPRPHQAVPATQSCQHPTGRDGQASPRGCTEVAHHLLFLTGELLISSPASLLISPTHYFIGHKQLARTTVKFIKEKIP